MPKSPHRPATKWSFDNQELETLLMEARGPRAVAARRSVFGLLQKSTLLVPVVPEDRLRVIAIRDALDEIAIPAFTSLTTAGIWQPEELTCARLPAKTIFERTMNTPRACLLLNPGTASWRISRTELSALAAGQTPAPSARPPEAGSFEFGSGPGEAEPRLGRGRGPTFTWVAPPSRPLPESLLEWLRGRFASRKEISSCYLYDMRDVCEAEGMTLFLGFRLDLPAAERGRFFDGISQELRSFPLPVPELRFGAISDPMFEAVKGRGVLVFQR